MKRITSVILCCLLFISLISCAPTKIESKVEEGSTSMFVCIESAPTYLIVYHKDTKVMYSVSYGMHASGIFTLLVNQDGSPMIWEDSQN